MHRIKKYEFSFECVDKEDNQRKSELIFNRIFEKAFESLSNKMKRPIIKDGENDK